MKVVPVSGALGAEVQGIDVRALSRQDAPALRDLVRGYEVVFFREAHLSPEEHMDLGDALGEVRIFPVARLQGAHQPTFQVIRDGPESPPEADYWHTDVTWIADPPDYAVLQAEVVPERGGDTLWASMTAAHDALSPATQEFLAGLTVVHDNTSFIDGVKRKMPPGPDRDGLCEQLRQTFPPVHHPMIRTHPDTGRRALFLGGHFMRRIEELTPSESEAVLQFLGRHIDDPAFHCRWRWTAGDIAIWDERSTNHRNAADYFPQVRQVSRIEIGSGRPYFQRTAA
jgi:taurine dioxygenase